MAQAYDISQLSPDVQKQVQTSTQNPGDIFNLPGGGQIQRAPTGTGYLTVDQPSVSSPAVVTSVPAASAIDKSLTDLNNLVITGSQKGQNIYKNTQTGNEYNLKEGGNANNPSDYIPVAPVAPTQDKTTPQAGDTSQGTSTTKTPTTNLIPGTSYTSTRNAGLDAVIKEHSDNASAYQAEADAIRKQLINLQNGTYVSPSTQSLMDSISKIYDDAITKQTQLNTSILGSYTMLGIRTGISRYAPGIEAGQLNQVMQAGIDKLTTIANQKASAIAKAQTAATQNDFNNLYKQMQSFQKSQSDETKAVTDLLKQAQDAATAANNAAKTQLANIQAQQKIDVQSAQDNAYIVLQYLDEKAGTKGESTLEEDQAAVKEYAAAHGLNADALLAKVEELKTTKDKYGSGPLGQYQFYADNEKAAGRTPLSYADYQASLKSKAASAKPTATQQKQGAVKDMYAQIAPVRGKDGYISPENYKTAKNAWVSKGLSPKDFDTNFSMFANPTHLEDYGLPTKKSNSSGGFQ